MLMPHVPFATIVPRCLSVYYKAAETLELDSYKNVSAWCKRLEARPATAKGMTINSSAEGGIKEYHSDE